MHPSPPREGRWRHERLLLAFLLVCIVGVGVLSVTRQAFLSRRMGDLGVFLRGGWAARQGGDELYQITDNNGWHYVYPPTLAILLIPMADPPPGVETDGVLPFPVLSVVWFLLNLGALTWGVHSLAKILDRDTPTRSGAWWALRLLPLAACAVPVINTARKGQVNLFLLALLCGWLVALARGKRARAGVFLGGAICLKVIPAFLLLVPLVRRDVRQLAACAMSLGAGLLLLPAAVFGPGKTVTLYQEYYREVLSASLKQDPHSVRGKELINNGSGDSQSFVAALHKIQYPDPYTRPLQSDVRTRLAHWALAGIMTGFTLLAFRRHWHNPSGPYLILFGGALIQTMMLTSPVCHLHYFCLSVPLFMGLVHLGLARGDKGSLAVLMGLIFLHGAGLILPAVPALQLLRDCGFATLLTLIAWSSACLIAFRAGRDRPQWQTEETPLPRAA